MSFILHGDNPDQARLGGKARTLAALGVADLPIPAWFVLSTAAFDTSLSATQRTALAAASTSTEALAALVDLTLCPDVEKALLAAIAALCPDGARIAVRSSASAEDSAQHSFAGQLESFLNVTHADAPSRVLDVWRSGFSARVYAYHREHKLPLPPPAPAVLIQRMVQADAAGVAFSADPIRGRRAVAVVSAVRGLGEALVAGEVDADTYHVAQNGQIVERLLVEQGRPALNDEQVQQVAALARAVERALGRPQDIEWAIEDDQLFLLQARPITSLAGLADPDGVYTLWDNSNIVESYGGITTPLTYSFARRAYEAVYQEFCRIMGVPQATIQANQAVFACMIGLVRGRIYYNLLNWYRVLALLPGFKANRQFMEQMMGVKESLPEAVAAGLEQSTWRERLLDRLYLLRTVGGLIANHFWLERRIRHFYARLTAALGEGRPDLSTWRADELVAYYRQLERQLLLHWDAPLVNDFFAMIFYGLLRKLTTAWCADPTGSLQNDLLAGEGGMISAEPAQQVRALANLAAQDKAFVQLLRTGLLTEIRAALPTQPAFERAYQFYLDRFGDRCQDELKLESPTLYDDPLPLLRSIGQVAASSSPLLCPSEQRRGGEKRVQRALAGKPLRRWLFGWVLRHARKRVRDRENLRFQRTRVFGRARQIFVELGRRFYAADALDEPRQVFYLNVDEILGFVEGTTTCSNLRGLAATRQAEFARFVQMPMPAERFVTYGAVHQGNVFQASHTPTSAAVTADELHGIGAAPGVVRGRARLVANPLAAQLAPGDILVAERTDPSWIMIMPAAAGLLVERGSLLSHAAIVSRELGIPSIVSLTGVTRWLQDGDLVEFDGSTGVVKKLTG